MFETIKRKLRDRTEKNAVKSELGWIDRKGKEHKETVYFKKSSLPLVGDWGRIYPIVDEYGNVSIVNLIFGGRKNFIKLLFIFLILSFAFYEVTNLLGDAKEYMNGSKYVIIEKTAFDKFCQKSIFEGGFEQKPLVVGGESLNATLFTNAEE